MTILSNTQVGEVVKQNFKTALLFQEHNIDYCCGGRKTLIDACKDVGIEVEPFINELIKITEQSDADSEFINKLNLTELSEYIIKRHHEYVKSNIPFLKASLDRICEVHGGNHPELFEIRKLFMESAGELTMHMQKEELMLFPFIRKIEKAKIENTSIPNSPFGSVANPINMMISEHDTEGERFHKIAEISQQYSIPNDACTTYSVTLQKLKEFENDLHRHIHLENNILFPKAQKLESELE